MSKVKISKSLSVTSGKGCEIIETDGAVRVFLTHLTNSYSLREWNELSEAVQGALRELREAR